MQLDTAQKRIVQSKSLGYSLVKGVTGTGKTTIAANRSIYLKNNYCLYEADKILMVAQSDEHLEYIQKINDKLEKDTQEYMTLFSNGVDKVQLVTIDNIIYNYFFEYERENGINSHIIVNEEQQSRIVIECIVEIKKAYKAIKILDTKYIKFFIEEINWIKDCNYTNIDIYQSADRIGRKIKKGEGPQRLLKNSKTREVNL